MEFAAKGQFRFRAQPVFPANVKAGEHTGALTFVVTYQLLLPVPQVLQVKNWICPLSREAGVNPEVWAALNGSYAPGRYLVDRFLNGKEAGKQILDVTPQEMNCV